MAKNNNYISGANNELNKLHNKVRKLSGILFSFCHCAGECV